MSRLRKDLIQQRFRRQLYNYRRHAVVQESMAEHLAALTSRLCSSQKMERVFEIGAGSAGLTAALLAKLQVSHYFANDLVPESAELVERLLADMRLPRRSFSQVISNNSTSRNSST